MVKKTGAHIQLDVVDLKKLIEDNSGDRLRKISLHRLNTYFIGLYDILKKYGGKIESNVGGSVHIVFEKTEDSLISNNVIRCIVACYIYTNDIFNKLDRYSKCKPIQISTSVSFGDFYEHSIVERKVNSKLVTIGSVVSDVSKMKLIAKCDYIYATRAFVETLEKETADNFSDVKEYKLSDSKKILKIENILSVKYTDILACANFREIESELTEEIEMITEIANYIDFSKIAIVEQEDDSEVLNFEKLSLNGKSKKLNNRSIYCIDIKGLDLLIERADDLKDVEYIIKKIYKLLFGKSSYPKNTFTQCVGSKIYIALQGGTELYTMAAMLLVYLMSSKIERIDKLNKVRSILKEDHLALHMSGELGSIFETRISTAEADTNLIISDIYKKLIIADEFYSMPGPIVGCGNLCNFILYENEVMRKRDLSEVMKPIDGTDMYLMHRDRKQKEV